MSDNKEQIGKILSDTLYYIRSDPSVDIEKTLAASIRQLGSLMGNEEDVKHFWRPTQHADLALNYMMERRQNKGLPGLDTGSSILNDMLGGFEPQNIYVLNARPGSGKTTLLLQWAWRLGNQTNTIFFSPEARAKLLSRRLLSALSGVPGQSIRRGEVSDAQVENAVKAKKLIASRPLYIYDMPEVSTMHMQTIIDKVEQETGNKVGAIFLDYLQQMEGEDSFQDLTNNMKSLETLIVKNDVACIMASQVGRASGDGSEQSAGKGTGKIEELATAVLGFVLRADYMKRKVKDYTPTLDDQDRKVLICSKNREEGIHFKMGLRFNHLTGWLDEEGEVD